MDLAEKIDNLDFRKPSPRTLFCELTSKCNLNCMHCFCNGYHPLNELEVGFDEWRNCIRQASKDGLFWVTFSGGEPFVYPKLFDLILYARQLGLTVSLKTNATLIGKSEVKFLKKLFVRDITISLYAMSPDVHDKITGIQGSFRKTLHAINLLKSENFCLHLTPVALKDVNIKDNDASEIIAVVKFAKENQFRYSIGFDMLPNYAGIRDTINEFQIPYKHIKLLLKEIYEDRDACKSSAICSCGVADQNGGIYVNPYGYISPCLSLPVDKIIDKKDNIRLRRFNLFRKKSRFFSILKTLTWDAFEECKSCKFRIYCHRCHLSNYIKYNSFYMSKIDCLVAQCTYKMMQERRNLNAKSRMENTHN